VANEPQKKALFPMSEIEFSLIMPCLNEVETLEACIRKAQQGLAKTGVVGEIIVADNGSTDGSLELAARLGARIVHVKQRGYGSALRGGILAAQGRYVIMADSDDSYDWSDLQPFVTALRQGSHLVMGTRFKGRIMPHAMPFLHRYLGNPVLTGLGRLFFRTHISDFHCGMRGFQREAIMKLGLVTTGMEFATEMVARASLAGLKMSEVPITLYPDGRSRPPHLRTWRDGWRHLSFMLLLSPNWVFLYPGLFFLGAGVLGSALLLPAPLVVGGVNFDVHSLLVLSTLGLVGFQTLLFWAVARVFAAKENLLPANGLIAQLTKGDYLLLGLLTGLALMLAGSAPILFSFLNWANQSFGDLNYQYVLRWLIPGLSLLAAGVSLFFASFVLALLNFSLMWSASPEVLIEDT
jgi:glycosyltransferase involved in cell wall biosynthesis